MPQVSIDRLTLHLSGISEEDGRRLARHIADRLGSADVPAGLPRQSIASNVAPREGSSLAEISELVVADLIRQLGRTL